MFNKFKESIISSVFAGKMLTMGFIGSAMLTYQYVYKDTNKDNSDNQQQQTVSQFILNQSQQSDEYLQQHQQQPFNNELQSNTKFNKLNKNNSENMSLFSQIVDQCFETCDYDGNGTIDERELYIALLLLYDKINRQLPCNIPVPKRIQVQQYMQQHDKNGDNCLDKQEFQEMASKMFFQSEQPFDSVFFNIAVGIFVYVVGLPIAAYYLKKFVTSVNFSGTKYVEKIPVAVLAGMMGVIIPFVQTGIMYQNYVNNQSTGINTT